MKKFCKKVAVFDLDGTIYLGNSHIEFLCREYNTKILKSLLYRFVMHFFPNINNQIIWWLYERKREQTQGFVLPYNDKVIDLLKKKQSDGFDVVIISNAPIELIINAAEDLRLKFIRADVGKKSLELQKYYTYNELFVCTDNKTDIDLLRIADEAVVIAKKRDLNFFKKRIEGKCDYWER